MAHVREQDPIRIKANTVPVFTSITVAELKIQNVNLGTANKNQSQHCAILHAHHLRRAKDKEAHWFTSITVAEKKTLKLIGSRQRARSNRIQGQHHAVLNVHHLRRAKYKTLIGSCQRARFNQIQSQNLPFFTSITIAELKTR